MSTKKSPWVTIQEDAFHTPVEAPKRRDSATSSTPQVTNKLFWGISFVLMIVVAAMILAPSEIGRILQGNLFEATPALDPAQRGDSVGQNTGTGFNLLPARITGNNEGAAAPEVLNNQNTIVPGDGPITEAQTAAVAIQVDPLAVTVEPITPTTDTANTTPVNPSPGVSATPVNTTPEVGAPTTPPKNAEAQVIVDLQKQLEDLKQQSETELAEMNQKVEEQQEQILAAAEPAPITPTPALPVTSLPIVSQLPNFSAPLHSAAQTLSQIPDFAETTQNLGQNAGQATSQYRLNPYRVTIQPQTILQQNLAGGSAIIDRSASSLSPSMDQANLNGVGKTPDSGPKETILIAFVATFLGLLAWKALRIMLA